LRIAVFCLIAGSLSPWTGLLAGSKANARSLAAQVPACTTTQIKISEVEADTTKPGNDKDLEWFELYNTGSQCEMNGWTITSSGASNIPLFTSSGGSNVVRIETMGHIIFATNKTNFLADHPGFVGAVSDIGQFGTGGLNDMKDFLRLRTGSASDVDCVTWGSPASNPCGFNAVAPSADTTATLQRHCHAGCPGCTVPDGCDTNTATDWTSLTQTPSGTPTAVLLTGLTARSLKARILIQWQTVSESEIVGYNLLRSTSPDGPYDQINPTLITAQDSGAITGASYQYLDANISIGTTYYYLLEVLNFDASSQRFGPIIVAFHGSNEVAPASLR
jgi:hypothetical protein